MSQSVPLETALRQIAKAGGLDADFLISAAAEDNIGGFHADPAQRQWPMGSMYGVEGQVLYALVRAMRPSLVYEIGADSGCSATHILTALEVNKKGKLVSVDRHESAGRLIPDNLRRRWKLLAGEAKDLVPESADIVLEDIDHGPQTQELLSLLKNCKMRLVLSHDAEHWLVGAEVRKGFQNAFGSCETVLISPSDCGYAYKFGPNGV